MTLDRYKALEISLGDIQDTSFNVRMDWLSDDKLKGAPKKWRTVALRSSPCSKGN